jgi:acetyl-CoA carboxylase biotin carboxylase subunit
MNTRLQVEHPVTECITGLDLVKEQIRVAEGEKLSFAQEDLKIHGHAIELRICAEDPLNNFLPSIGKLEVYERPQGAGVRVDDCVEPGSEIPIYYDNMLAKLIAWGPDRASAIARLKRAISEYRITGIETTLQFGNFVLNHPDFIEGHFDTHFIAKNYKPESMEPEHLDLDARKALSIAAAHFFAGSKGNSVAAKFEGAAESDNWMKNRKKYYS